ncbi:hypothetical protein C8T65DRAFT_236733 [Cerioporus squamosus]|nr:hypothetical protein C8T65DRAFT_236733 [Cerioporus squamosus]
MLANGDEMLVVVKDAGGADTEETPPFVFNSAIGGPPTHSAPQSLTHSAPLDVQSAKLHETPDRPRSSPLPAHEPQAGLRVNTAFPALYEQRRVRDSSSAHQTHTASPSTPRSSGLAFGSSNLAKSRRGGLFSSFSAVTNYASSFLGDSGGSSRNSSQEREAPKTLSSMRSLPTSVRSVERQQSPVARFGDIAHAHVPDPEPLPVSPSPSATVRPPSFKEATTETPTAPTDSPETGERTVADGISEAMGGSCLVSHEGSADAQQASGAQTQRADRAQGFDNESRDIVKTDLDSVAAGEQGVHGVTEVAGDASAEHDRDQEEDENEPLSNWVQVIKDRNAAIAARSDEGSDAEDSGVEKLPSSPRRNKKPHLPIRVHQLAGSDGDQSSPSTPTTTDAYENESNDPDNSTTSTTVSPGHSRRQRRKGGQKKSPKRMIVPLLSHCIHWYV